MRGIGGGWREKGCEGVGVRGEGAGGREEG